MKVALVIFRFGPSHGSILQTYALTRTLERMGHEVTIIDRQRPIRFVNYYSCLKRIIRAILAFRSPFEDYYLKEFPNVVMSKLNLFIDEQLREQTVTVTRESELIAIGKLDYDAYVIGSDQTWRPKYVYNIYNYYLNFVPKERHVKKLAYAASFGTGEWEYSEEQTIRCCYLVNAFNGISVREKDGVSLCREHFGVDAKFVLDPTMLLKAEDYLKVIALEEKNGSYIGYNYLDFTIDKMKIVDFASKVLNVPARQVNSMTESPGAKLKDRIAPSIDSWISGIANADFVIADSFHATVFAIIFHRPFLAIANERRGLSRFISLLSMVGLDERLLIDKCVFDEALIKKQIDWNSVDNKIKAMREKSILFLENSLL